MENFQDSIDKLNSLNNEIVNHIKQMEEDYLNHYLKTKGVKVGDIIYFKGFHHLDGHNATNYHIVSEIECEFTPDTKYDYPDRSEMENRFYISMTTNELLDSGISKRTNYYSIDDFKVLCSQDRLKDICKEIGIKYELNRKTLKRIADITIKSL